jgi:hypothetical protein
MTSADTRSTERVLLAIPIRVVGIQCRAGEFMEDARTCAVNGAGARIALKHPVAVDDTLRIINLHNYSKADFRVVAPAGKSDQDVMEWGVRCLDPGENIWGIEFAPPLRGKAGALIQCQVCEKEGFVALAENELESLTSGGLLRRECRRCNELTDWAYSNIGHPPREHQFGTGLTSPVRPGQRGEPASQRANDRRGLKLPILVRGPQGQEEVSKTENISVGGLAVSLAMELNAGDSVRVVHPYSPVVKTPERKAAVRRRATYAFGGRRLYGLQLLG